MELEKAIQRIDKQILEWQDKLRGYQKELAAVENKLPALEKHRDSFILPARAEGDQKAQIKLNSANVEVSKLREERHELEVLVEQVQKKICELEEQKKGYERQAQIFALNEMRDKRADMAKEIENLMGGLLPLLEGYRNVGREMYALGKTLECGHASLYAEDRLASFLHGQLGKILPTDFQGSLSRRVQSLVKADQESLDAVLEAHGLRVASNTEGKAVANG